MANFRNDFLNTLKEERTNYSDMVKFCTDSLILNNEIIAHFPDCEEYCGTCYDEENDNYIEIFQYYIIDEQGAERFAEYTNEIVIYIPDIDIYLLCVTHFGTCWQGVPSNWKDKIEE